ncbi:TraR/DksA C4-type zinc finger protein [Variovorax boronicumulans]|uniref:TraR/DksA C4-type zinc finger protein n=1 Tax=Variovorax boronicumulans TaxID=436515 RepID=UPI003397ECE1
MRHLNATDRLVLQQQLDTMKGQVLDELRASAPSDGFASAAGNHEVRSHADDAEAERAADVLMAEIEVDRARLHEIEHAIARMADGRYGICENCGSEIPRARLFAQPTAIRCTACQVTAESHHRH